MIINGRRYSMLDLMSQMTLDSLDVRVITADSLGASLDAGGFDIVDIDSLDTRVLTADSLGANLDGGGYNVSDIGTVSATSATVSDSAFIDSLEVNYITKDVDLLGNYLLNDQTTVNMQAGEAVWSFDDNYIEITDNANFQNPFDGGGALSFSINPKSDGGNSTGELLFKRDSNVGWLLATVGESAGFISLRFRHEFSTVDGVWESAVSIPIDQWSDIVVVYNSDAVVNDPIFYLKR